MNKENKKNEIRVQKSKPSSLYVTEETIIIYSGKNKIGEIVIQLKNKTQYYKELIEFGETIKDVNQKEKLLHLKSKVTEEIKYIINIDKLYVDSRYQNKGYRTKLLNLAIERYKSKNLESRIFSLTRQQLGDVSSEKLSEIYKKFGFDNSIKLNDESKGIVMYNNIEEIHIKEKSQPKPNKDVISTLSLN